MNPYDISSLAAQFGETFRIIKDIVRLQESNK